MTGCGGGSVIIVPLISGHLPVHFLLWASQRTCDADGSCYDSQLDEGETLEASSGHLFISLVGEKIGGRNAVLKTSW